MNVVHVTPTETVTEQLSVQRVGDMAGARQLRANVWTIAEGSMLRHSHREQEELYLVLDGVAQLEVEQETFRLAERDALSVPAGLAHKLTNIGVGPLTVLVAAAPPAAADSTIEEQTDRSI
jgi:mannose-6-phosphate isomerase-like protein (cupin superfamily)